MFSTAKSPRSFVVCSLAVATFLAATSLVAAPKPAVSGPLTFEKDIRPILKAHHQQLLARGKNPLVLLNRLLTPHFILAG